MGKIEYRYLTEVISMEGFNFATHKVDEVFVLTPRLEELGYKNVEWKDGESDSFGPLTRVCQATLHGYPHRFFYG